MNSYGQKQAWAAFHKHKKAILNHHVPLGKRLQFFDACVTTTILFSLHTLPLTRKKVEELDRLQKKMLRRIIGWRRAPNEEWHETMRRMSLRLEHAQSLYYCEEWSTRYARNLWRYADYLVHHNHSHWAKLMTWGSRSMKEDPHALFAPHRYSGRPKTRWDDGLARFFETLFPDSDAHWLQLFPSICSIQFESEFIAHIID